jgi:hypothetical protein
VRLPQGLLRRLDVPTALAKELENPPDRLLSRAAERAVAEHTDEYVELLRTHLRSDFDVSDHEIVWVPKARGRYRPVSSLPIDDRVLYRALALDVQKEAEEDLAVPPKSDFERAMLDERSDSYFARADIASYYNYVDHQLVHERVIEEAARADTADAIVAVLSVVLGRAFGLPQNVGASEVFGELVLMPVVDRLARSGISAYRRNDDFYLPASTWDEAIGVIEQLQTELYAIGLTLNEEKTRVWKRDTLEGNVGRVVRRLREILAEHELDPDQFEDLDEYTGETKGAETDEEDEEGEAGGDSEERGISREDLVSAAVELLQESIDEWRGDRPASAASVESPDDPAVARSAVLSLIRMLGRLESDAALANGATILRTDPGATQTWVRSYLAPLSGEGIDIATHVEELLDAIGPAAPGWQQAWLMDPLLDSDLDLSPRLITWLKAFFHSREPATLRVRALMVLGLHDELEPAQISDQFDIVPSVARPDVAAALAFRVADGSHPSLKPVRRAGRLYSWIIDTAIENIGQASSL